MQSSFCSIFLIVLNVCYQTDKFETACFVLEGHLTGCSHSTLFTVTITGARPEKRQKAFLWETC